MADKTVLIELSVEGKNALSKVNELTNSLKTLEKGTDEYKQAVKELAEQERILTKAQKARDKAQKESSKQMKQVKTDTGAATSATLELGRVFSDMPYGIRGVANNLQQLAANLFFMSKKTDGVTGKMKGFGGAIGSLIKNLAGPAGLLVLFQAATAALDYFTGGATKSKKAIGELTRETYASGLVARQYVKELEDVNLNEERREVIVQELIKSVPTLKKEDLEYGKNLDKVREKIRQYTLSQAGRIEMEKLVQENSALLSKQMKVDLVNSTEDQEEKVKIIKALLKEEGIELEKAVNQSYAMGQANLTLRNKTNNELIEDFKVLAERIKKESDPILEQVDNLSRALALDPSKDKNIAKKVKKISPFKTLKELELDVKDNEKAILDFTAKILQEQLKIELNDKLSTAKTEKEKNKIRREYSVKRLLIQIDNERKTLELKKKTELEIAKAKTESHKDDLKKAHELYKYKIENDPDLKDRPELKNKLLKKAKETYDVAKKQANTELTDTLGGIEDRYKPLFTLFSKLSIERVKALFGDPKNKDKDDDKIKTDLARWTKYAETAKAIISTITDFVDGEFNRQLTIEQNKTNALNNELNKRLLDENLSKDEREKIQNEIAQNDEKLRLKQEKIEKKRFKMQKAANIATTLINTAVAAAGVMADAQGGFFARLSQAIPTIAFGLAQVATIARTKFQSSAGSSPALVGGGSSGGSARAEPSFNIVGRSNENVLMSAIQSQFDQPLRAYVVARDVTNQQQLDGVISGAAST